MADERDPQISQRYRELGREEPRPTLDRAILDAARRSTTRRNRWYPSLAAAAVLVFAVALVVQMERQPPSDQVPMSAPAQVANPPAQDKVMPQESPAKPAAPRRAAPQFTPEPPPHAETSPRAPTPAPAPAPEPSANIAAPAAGVAAQAERKRADETRAVPQYERSTAAPRSAASTAVRDEEPAERWLERIARMRELGQDEAADKELVRFRERYPDYRIPDAMAKKLEKQAPATPAR